MPCRAEASGHEHTYCIITVTNLSISRNEKEDVSREFPEIDSAGAQNAQNAECAASLRRTLRYGESGEVSIYIKGT